MKVCVSGASGLVGSALIARLESEGVQVLRLVRREASGGEIAWNPERDEIETEKLSEIDAMIHLAGENIAHGRWTPDKKLRIRDSRVHGTRLIVRTLAELERPPKTFLCASAIGYYGDRPEEKLTEQSGSGTTFLAELCREWEEAALEAKVEGMRVLRMRIGVVLSRKGGALAKMLLPFRLGLGGRVGKGHQYWSWISIDDVAGAIWHILQTPELHGAVNLVAPESVTNREFTKTLGRVLRRPTIFPMPGFAAKIALGEMAEELLLSCTRVFPTRLLETGYTFQHPQLEGALRTLLAKPE